MHKHRQRITRRFARILVITLPFNLPLSCRVCQDNLVSLVPKVTLARKVILDLQDRMVVMAMLVRMVQREREGRRATLGLSEHRYAQCRLGWRGQPHVFVFLYAYVLMSMHAHTCVMYCACVHVLYVFLYVHTYECLCWIAHIRTPAAAR